MMRSYLVSKGYKYTTKNDLNLNEFTLVSQSVSLDMEYTTFNNPVFLSVQNYQLFVNKEIFTDTYVADKFRDIDTNAVVEFSADLEKQENGYIVTLSFTIRNK